MIEVTCDGGRIGRLCWDNNRESGAFFQGRQPRTFFVPGRLSWDEPWPKIHGWPISPWGEGDFELHDYFADYVAFGAWLDRELERRGIEVDIDLLSTISMYALLCDVFASGVNAGTNPWLHADQVRNRLAFLMSANHGHNTQPLETING